MTTPTRPVVLIAEELSPATIETLGDGFDIRHCDGADRDELKAAVAEADAILIRSATTMDEEAIGWAPNLKVIARAGIGLDNVDIPAATARGVMVVNAPQSNIVSAAEQAVALLLAASRHLVPANAALKEGIWARSKFTGVEVSGKVVGVLGLGRIGVLVAQRLSAFGVTLIAYDPYVSVTRAAQLGVRLVTLDELLAESDFITVHLPKTPETNGLIGAAELAKTKRGVIIVNAARGGLVKEDALFDALQSGQVYAAGLDVYAKEPCTDSPLFALKNVVAAPHLGASTDEAQEKAGLAVARSVKLALSGEFVPDAVNVQAGGVVAEEVRPALPLVEKLGEVLTGLAGAPCPSVTVEVRGEVAAHDVRVLQLAAMRGIFAPVTEGSVSYVNAPLLATERGVAVELVTSPESPDFRSLITLRGVQADGTTISVGGTLTGPRQIEKIVSIDGFSVDLPTASHLLVMRYADKPGVVGTAGSLLGAADVNIAGMQVSRSEDGGESLMVLTLDDAAPATVVDAIAKAAGATSVRAVDVSVA